jgi:hypothetical protein
MTIARSATVGAPFVKFVELGSTLVGAFASDSAKCRRQVMNYETKKPEFKDDGVTPLLEEVMHFIAMPGTTAGVGDREALEPIEPGTHVRYAVSKWKWGQVIDARKGLPAVPESAPGAKDSVGAGKEGTDIYTITLVGWSAETKNPDAAKKAGFTVVEGRIVLRSHEDKDKYVLAKSRQNENSNTAGDFEITIRRAGPQDKQFEQLADELYLTKPWESQAAVAAADERGSYDDTEEPF